MEKIRIAVKSIHDFLSVFVKETHNIGFCVEKVVESRFPVNIRWRASRDDDLKLWAYGKTPHDAIRYYCELTIKKEVNHDR